MGGIVCCLSKTLCALRGGVGSLQLPQLVDGNGELAHFMYGHGFWYALPEIEDLSEAELFWVPDATVLPILWRAGHSAHRERLHIGRIQMLRAMLKGEPDRPC